MARKLKPYKVDTVAVGTGNDHAVLDVMFDRDNLEFFVEVAPDKVTAASVEEVKAAARKQFRDGFQYAWEALIDVRVGTCSRWHGDDCDHVEGLELRFRRFERAKARNRGYVQRRHPLDWPEGHEGVAAARVTYCDNEEAPGPYDYGDDDQGEQAALLAYDQAVWDALVQAEQVLDRMRRSLGAMLAREDVARALLGAGKLLRGKVIQSRRGG